MSKLRATISYQHCINEKQKSDYVIGPINTNADNTKDTDECILISDEESENRSIFKDDEVDQILDLDKDYFELDKNSEIMITNWDQITTEWEKMLKDELEGQNNIDDFYDEEENDEIDNIHNQTHPAIDIDAKWQIVDLFTKNLELPTLFSNN